MTTAPEPADSSPRGNTAGATSGLELQARREAIGLAQNEIAALLGIRQDSISRWENGTSTPRRDVLTPAYDALEAGLEALAAALADTARTIQQHHGGIATITPSSLAEETATSSLAEVTALAGGTLAPDRREKLIRIAAGRARRQMARETNAPAQIIDTTPAADSTAAGDGER